MGFPEDVTASVYLRDRCLRLPLPTGCGPWCVGFRPTGAQSCRGVLQSWPLAIPTAHLLRRLASTPLATEFLRRGSLLLSGSERRLATLDSLGTASLAHLNNDQVQLVIAECAAYFQVNPYSRWFNPLDQILQGLGVSYFSNTACHLDLVQWATDPIWGKISDKSLRSELLEDGVPHLRNQLEHYDIRTILLNGGQVLRQVQDIGLVELREAGRMDLGPRTYHLVTGESNGIQWLGWSANLQSSFGITSEFKARLRDWVADVGLDRPPEKVAR